MPFGGNTYLYNLVNAFTQQNTEDDDHDRKLIQYLFIPKTSFKHIGIGVYVVRLYIVC